MSLNINLFVHGVPMGQKIWGLVSEDRPYISSFYGPKWDAPEVMKIDIMTFGGITYAYYSFIKGQKLCDSQGRAGAYFALTLRLNAFYADIQNIYNILKATYEKMCIGLCVQETNDSTQFIVDDFQCIENKLKEIEQYILKYIGDFSINDDILGISGFASSGNNTSKNINLFECNKNVAINIIRQTGKLLVSPHYLSERATTIVNQYKAELKASAEKAQYEFQLLQRNTQDKIDNITKQSREELELLKVKSHRELESVQEQSRIQLSQMREEYETKISNIRQEYAGIDSKLEGLKSDLKSKDKEIKELHSLCQSKDKELKTYKSKIEELNNRIQDFLQSSPTINSIGEYNTNKYVCWKRIRQPNKLNWIVISVISFFFLLLIVLGLYFIRCIGGQKDLLQAEVKKDPIEEKTKKEQTSVKNDNIEIIIDGITEDNNFVEVGRTLKISLSNDTILGEGEWYSNEFTIENDFILAKRDYAGRIGVIYYIFNSDTIAKREIEIKPENDNE